MKKTLSSRFLHALSSVRQKRCNKKITRKQLLLKKKIRQYLNTCLYPVRAVARCLAGCLNAVRNKLPVLHPYSKACICWDFCYSVMIIINTILIPFCVAFEQLIPGAVFYASTAMLILNVLISLHVSYFEKGLLVADRDKIQMRFIKNNMLFEMAVLLCYNLPMPAESQFLRLVFIIKLYDYIKISAKFREINLLEENYLAVINLFVLVCQVGSRSRLAASRLRLAAPGPAWLLPAPSQLPRLAPSDSRV